MGNGPSKSAESDDERPRSNDDVPSTVRESKEDDQQNDASHVEIVEQFSAVTSDSNTTKAFTTTKPSNGITRSQLLSVRSALRERLQDDVLSNFLFMGNAECVDTLVSLFARTIQHGQNQSSLLLGSAGFGQKQIVTNAMRRLRRECGAYTPIYLNGTILTNEIEAFKEILAQLTRDKSIKHPVLSYNTMYSYLRSLLRMKAKANEPTLLVIDGLEHFAHKGSAKQLLLYNLLDWLQFRDVQMGVLGITEDFGIMDALEKRVRSRFSKLQIVVPVRSFESMTAMVRNALTLHTVDWTRAPSLDQPPHDFVTAFDQRVGELFLFTKSDEYARFQTAMEGLWDKSRSPAYFVRLAVSAISYLSEERPLLAPFHFQRALTLLEPNYQLATLRSISDHGLALLIGMSHLENDGHTFFTLEMVYQKWQDFMRKHDLQRLLPTRPEAQQELEILIDLKLVNDAGDPFRISRVKHAPAHFLQPEFRAVHLNFEPKTLQSMVRSGSIQCSTAMTEWMLNGS